MTTTETRLEFTVGEAPIRYNGQRYAPGAPIALDAATAGRLRSHVLGPGRPIGVLISSPGETGAAGGANPGTNSDPEAAAEALHMAAEALTPPGGKLADALAGPAHPTTETDAAPAGTAPAASGRARKAKE